MIKVDALAVSAGRFCLADISFSIPARSYTVLTGPTGSGKTTILETICGLKQSAAGRVELMGRDVTDLKPALRGVGYVPQDRALFGSMSVYENVAFSLRVRRWDANAVDERVRELAEMLGIGALLTRRPARLSGGESQRVALARALASRPQVLLLDEPLSALDDQSRGQIHELLENVCRQSAVTVLHVTHHLADAQRLADQVLRLENGKVGEIAIANWRSATVDRG